jgi:hypothetical protein
MGEATVAGAVSGPEMSLAIARTAGSIGENAWAVAATAGARRLDLRTSRREKVFIFASD